MKRKEGIVLHLSLLMAFEQERMALEGSMINSCMLTSGASGWMDGGEINFPRTLIMLLPSTPERMAWLEIKLSRNLILLLSGAPGQMARGEIEFPRTTALVNYGII